MLENFARTLQKRYNLPLYDVNFGNRLTRAAVRVTINRIKEMLPGAADLSLIIQKSEVGSWENRNYASDV